MADGGLWLSRQEVGRAQVAADGEQGRKKVLFVAGEEPEGFPVMVACLAQFSQFVETVSEVIVGKGYPGVSFRVGLCQ